jgi:HD-GYP domain-containing protein (c-di-GMP phosphodiesterase class II)
LAEFIKRRLETEIWILKAETSYLFARKTRNLISANFNFKDMLAEVHRHPCVGMSILKYFRFPPPIPEYVYCHHERIDGKGYPCGISSAEIPLGAKIISVADCFDAITTDRPYQKGKSIPEALLILDQLSGKSLSPEIVADLFKEIRQNEMSERRQKKSRSNDFRISR